MDLSIKNPIPAKSPPVPATTTMDLSMKRPIPATSSPDLVLDLSVKRHFPPSPPAPTKDLLIKRHIPIVPAPTKDYFSLLPPTSAKLPKFLPPPHPPLSPKLPKFFPMEPPPLEPPPPGRFSPKHFSRFQEMHQCQSQLAQHPMVCSSSFSPNNIFSKNPTTTTTTNLTTTNGSFAANAESMTILRNNLIEIFPSIIISKDEEEVKFLSRENFKNHAAQAYPFIQFKFENSEYISYYGLESCSSDNDKIEDDKRERLYRLLKATKLLDERTGNENVSWTKLDDVFKKLPVSFRKKKTSVKTGIAAAAAAAVKINREKHREEHADTRLGFRFDNMFAVKRFFTFGEKIVNPGEVHLIQTSEVPILYNEFKLEHYRNKRKISQSTTTTSNVVYEENFDGLFDPMDQKYYNTYVLNPHTIYKIPPNTIYVLITIQKTLFSLDRVDLNKYEKMRIENWRWQQLDIYPPQAHKQLQIQLPASGNPVVVCSRNAKRKKLLDYEKKWVYNDVLNPPQFFTQPKQIIVEGGEDDEIQFSKQYFYFEPNNQYYYHQQQEQQQQNVLMFSSSSSSSSGGGGSGSGSENNEEMIITPPVICSYSPPHEQQQQQIYPNDDDKNNNVVVENLVLEQSSPTPLNEDVEMHHTSSSTTTTPLKESSSLSDETTKVSNESSTTTTTTPQNNENDLIFDDINDLPPPSVQQEKEYSDIMDQLNSLVDNYNFSSITTPPPPLASCDNENNNPIPTISFEDMIFTEPQQQQQPQQEIVKMFGVNNSSSSFSLDNNSSTNFLDNVSSPAPPENVIKNCNKLLEDINDFAKNCL